MDEHGGTLDPGVRSNLRLTSVVGVAMLVPLVLVSLTGLAFDQFWRVHYFAGFLLVPLLLVKLGSTGWRMTRYYLGNPRYRAAGPPRPLLRILAPVLVVSTVVVFVSGIVMWFAHSRLQPWSTLHTDAAVVFAISGSIHVLAYLRTAGRETAAELSRRREAIPPRARRRGAVVASLAVGLVLAVVTIAPSQQPAHLHHDRVDGAGQFIGAPPGG
jgi:amino acid transporter